MRKILRPTTDRHMERDGERARLLLLSTDNAHAAALMQLLPDESYDVISCPIPAVADLWLEELEPDLILLAAPTEAAPLIEACEALRTHTTRPAVMLSHQDQEGVIADALAAGIDEYWRLPIGVQELCARLDAMLRRLDRTGGLSETIRAGNLSLSAADRSVELDDRHVLLSPIEFRLLACLASAPGKIFTHHTLMARVWGAEYVDSRNYLHLYIRYLREKIEVDPAQPQMILSEWGVGYRLLPLS